MKLELKKLSKKFEMPKSGFFNWILGDAVQVEALKSIDLEIKEKEVIGVIGRNGSGKTTLLRIIAGIYKPTIGEIEKDARIAYIDGFRKGLKPQLSVGENINSFGLLLGKSPAEIKQKYESILKLSGLERFEKAKLENFTPGMISRLNFAIASSFIEYEKVNIILLDEIFSNGIDAEFKERAIEKIKEMKKHNLAIIIVSHDLKIITELCNKAILIDNGEIISQGRPSKVILDYENKIETNGTIKKVLHDE